MYECSYRYCGEKATHVRIVRTGDAVERRYFCQRHVLPDETSERLLSLLGCEVVVEPIEEEEEAMKGYYRRMAGKTQQEQEQAAYDLWLYERSQDE